MKQPYRKFGTSKKAKFSGIFQYSFCLFVCSIWTIDQFFFNKQFYFLYFCDSTPCWTSSQLHDCSSCLPPECSPFSTLPISNIGDHILNSVLHLLDILSQDDLTCSWCFICKPLVSNSVALEWIVSFSYRYKNILNTSTWVLYRPLKVIISKNLCIFFTLPKLNILLVFFVWDSEYHIYYQLFKPDTFVYSQLQISPSALQSINQQILLTFLP